MNTEDLYPSRNGQQETLLQRQDPVVYPSHTTELNNVLTDTQLQSYEDNGFLVLPDYMPELVAPLLDEVTRLKGSLKGYEELITEPDSDQLRTLFKPFAYSQRIRDFFRHPKIINIARRLLGDEVYMMQSRVNVKPGFTGRSFPWHSDFETWHVEDGMPRMRAVTAWIMLTDNEEHNGPLYVVPGSHKEYVSCAGVTGENNHLTSLKKQTLGVPSPDSMQQLMQNRELTSVTGKAGTVVFHECNIMHGSPDNISPDPRSILMCVFNSVQNACGEPFSGLKPRPHYLNNPDRGLVTPLTPLGLQAFEQECGLRKKVTA